MKDTAKSGDVLYFKRGKRQPLPNGPQIEFNGHACGIFLCEIPPFRRPPILLDFLRILGTVGYIRFEDLKEFYGEEFLQELSKKFVEKYYPKIPGAVSVEESPKSEPTQVVAKEDTPFEAN